MKQITLFVLFQIFILSSCQTQTQRRKVELLKSKINDGSIPFVLSNGLNQFNNDLFPLLEAKHDKNIIISPFSLHTALSMTLVGSPSESKTYRQLSEALYGNENFDQNSGITRQIIGIFYHNLNFWYIEMTWKDFFEKSKAFIIFEW